MCLIIHKPAGADVPRDLIESAQYYNQDGVGIMAEGRVSKWLRIGPGKLRKHILRHTGDCAVHFRMATHGIINRENVHPFRIANGGYLMHNGVLWSYAPKQKNAAISDTRAFVTEYVNPMLAIHGALDLDKVADEATGSALAIMQGSRIDLTGDSWVEHEGLRLSNTYAWNAPAHLVDTRTYEIHGDAEADGATVIDSREFSSTDRAWWEREMRRREADRSDHIPTVYDPDRAAALEDLLSEELIARVDEIDFADRRLLAVANTALVNAVLAGQMDGAQFIEAADADSLLEMRLQLERRA